MGIIRYNLTGIQLVLGEGAVQELEEELKKLSVFRPLLVTDENLWKLGVVQPVMEELKKRGIFCESYHGVRSDPLDSMVAEGLQVYREQKCDGVVSIGGGSSMDTGKCISHYDGPRRTNSGLREKYAEPQKF